MRGVDGGAGTLVLSEGTDPILQWQLSVFKDVQRALKLPLAATLNTGNRFQTTLYFTIV